jgi:hypothetical protein
MDYLTRMTARDYTVSPLQKGLILPRCLGEGTSREKQRRNRLFFLYCKQGLLGVPFYTPRANAQLTQSHYKRAPLLE